MYYVAIILIIILIISFALFYNSTVQEPFWDRSNIVPIPPPKNYPQYAIPDYPPINQYIYNTGFAPYTPSYLNEVPAQQVQLQRSGSPWFYTSRAFPIERSLNNIRLNNFPTYYPNYQLPAQVIGCGGRRAGCMGGTEIPIPNMLPPINISNQNVAPVNLTVRGFDNGVQQVGTIQKVFGDENKIYPLFGQKLYNNDSRWRYFVRFGDFGVILPVIKRGRQHYYSDNCMEELGTNDEVFIQNQKNAYRVTMYDENIPQYLGTM